MKTKTGQYLLSKGFIDGLDVKNRRVFGLFVVVMCGEKLLYQGQLFSFRPVSQDIPWGDLVTLLNEPKDESRNEDLLIFESNLQSYIELNKFYQAEIFPLDSKALERKITQFCDEILRIKSIVFIESADISKEGLLSLIPALSSDGLFAEDCTADQQSDETEQSPDSLDGKGQEQPVNEVFVMLEPVLDPVIGIPTSDLAAGDSILCRLPEDSSYYSFFQGCIPDFNGTVKGEVTGVNITDYGSAVIAINLAEGLSGVIKAPKWVRVRTSERGLVVSEGVKKSLSFEIIVAGIGMILFLLAMSLFVYFFS